MTTGPNTKQRLRPPNRFQTTVSTKPGVHQAVYNLGGGRESNVSILEAIELCQRIAGRELAYTLSDQARIGDHQWYVSDFRSFKVDYPEWRLTYGIEDVLRDIYERNVERWLVATERAPG